MLFVASCADRSDGAAPRLETPGRPGRLGAVSFS